MTTLPEEAVKAAIAAHNKYYDDLVVYPSEEPTPEGAFHAALKAALPCLPVQGAVKKLAWTKGVVDIAQPMPGMKYVACNTTPKGSWAWWLDNAPETRGVFTSEEAAKAAAQADYEARVMSALEPSAARDLALEEGYRQGIEAAAQKAAEMLVFADTTSTADREIPAAIRAIGTSREQLNKAVSNVPDQQKNELGAHGERVRVLVDALEVAKNELQAWIKCADENGLCVTSTPHVIDHIDIALASLSSPDHADAGKVEGDGNRETLWKSAARDFGAYLALNGTPYAIDYWNECFDPLFSAPSEGAE